MRNFRNAAVASATAAALVLGGATVATAETTENGSSATTETKAKDNSLIFKGPLQVGETKDGNWPNSNHKEKDYFATDHFGQDTDDKAVPDWARWWVDSSIVGAIGAVIGLIIAAANYASYNGWIKL
ncbi:hypothetical protein [Corynebacterium riegelii]|uniref:hypothetical protein n=1 Tax=Corynebacterium riegelii TaxID=156976 RepID=UPI00288C4DDE|nr:hypothetical protein [Corynebacterium riegelii]